MDWLAKFLKLPTSFMLSGTSGGVSEGTISEAILCTVVAARDRVSERVGEENIAKLMAYSSNQTHSTYAKVCKIADILPRNNRSIETTSATKFSLSPEGVRAAIEADVAAGLVPLFLCVTVGTTSTTVVDPVSSLVNVAKEYGVWVHVYTPMYASSSLLSPLPLHPTPALLKDTLARLLFLY